MALSIYACHLEIDGKVLELEDIPRVFCVHTFCEGWVFGMVHMVSAHVRCVNQFSSFGSLFLSPINVLSTPLSLVNASKTPIKRYQSDQHAFAPSMVAYKIVHYSWPHLMLATPYLKDILHRQS